MSRNNLAHLIARNPVPTNLRERAAALRLTAARLTPRTRQGAPLFFTTRNAPTDWADPPEGFMAYPALAPAGFLALEYALPQEAQRLYRIAQRELDRVTAPDERASALSSAEVDRRRRALRVDELKAAAYGPPIEGPGNASPVISPKSPPSRLVDLLLQLVVLRNAVNGPLDRGPQTDEETNEACDRIRFLEYDLFTHPSRNAADLAIKLRAATEHLEPRGLIAAGYTDAPEVRAWQGLAADIERLARGTDIAGTVTAFDGRPDPMARPAPILRDITGGADPVLIAIEAARTATRRTKEWHPGDEQGVSGELAAEAAAETERRVRAEDAAYCSVFRLRPTTREGLFALVDYARERVDYHAEYVRGSEDAPDVLGAIRDGMAMLMDGTPEAVGPDPVLEAIKWERVAWQAAKATDLGEDEIERRSRKYFEEWDAMLAVEPVTFAGLLAQVRAIRAGGGERYDVEEIGGFFDLIGDHLSRLMGPQAAAVSGPTAASLLDCAALSVTDLRSGHDIAGLLSEVATAILSQPRCWQDGRENHNAIGRFVREEADRMHAVRRACREDLRQRGRLGGAESDTRFEVLSVHAIEHDDEDALAAAFALRDADRMGA